MTQTNGSTRPRFSPMVKTLMVVGAITAVALITLIALTSMSRARWERYAAALRNDGPLTFDEIEAQRTKIPDERNSALVIEGLNDLLNEAGQDWWAADESVWPIKGNGPDFFSGIARHQIEPTRAFVNQHRKLLTKLAVLRDMPTGRFPIPTEEIVKPDELLFGSLAGFRPAAKLEYVDCALRLTDGNLEQAAEILHLQFHLAATLDEYPSVIGRLVQIAVEAMSVRGIENVLRVGELEEQTLAELADTVDSRRAAGTMKWALLGERAWFIEITEKVATGTLSMADVADMSGRGFGIPLAPEILARRSQVCGTEMLTWLVEAADKPSEMIEAAARINRETPLLSATHFLVTSLMPTMSTTINLHLRGIAHLDCARAAVAAERFRLATGRLPETLDELVPDYLDAVPTDPFDEAPLRLATTDTGIVIYSIADNRVDDGGIVQSAGTKARPLDVGFRLLRPQHRGLLLIDAPPPNDD